MKRTAYWQSCWSRQFSRVRDMPGRTSPGRCLRSRHPDQPSRSRLCRRAVLEHSLGHRSRRQQAARRYPARRSAAGQFQPALSRPVAGARLGIFARSSHPCRRRDRLECREFHRYRDQHRQARHLCRALAARGVLYAGRQGSLGDGAGRELCRRARRHDLRGKDADRCGKRPGHDDLFAGREIRLCLLVVHA